MDCHVTDVPPREELDIPALRAKYYAERDKRLRPEGNEQYIEVTGSFAHYLDDPYMPVVPRPAII